MGLDQKSLMLGTKNMLPIMPSVMLFGLIFGITGNFADLSFFLVSAMSYVIFAGSAQFLVVVLISENQELGAIIIAGLIINLRHLLFSANMSELIKTSRMKRIFISYLLTDEAFIVTTNINKEIESGKIDDEDYILEDVLIGGGFTLWFLWNVSTILGFLLANSLSEPEISTSFIVAATFLGYLLSHWTNSEEERKFILLMVFISFLFSFVFEGSELIILILLIGIVFSIIFKKLGWQKPLEVVT